MCLTNRNMYAGGLDGVLALSATREDSWQHSGPLFHLATGTVPTGGWTLALDQAAVVDGVAKLFLTLERPAEGEMVTQALVTHRERYTTTQPFERVEVYIHLAQRGVQTLTTNYRLAAEQPQLQR